MQTDVFRRLEESSATPVYWTLAQVKEALNDGYEEISDTTEWFETSTSVNKTTSTYYDLSSVLASLPLTVTGVYNPETVSWLEPTTERELDTTYTKWMDAGGEPGKVLMRGLWWMGVFPKADAATGTLVIHYSALPPALSADGDTPGFPKEHHVGLVEYAVYDLLCQDAEFKKAEKYYARYLVHQEKLRAYVKGGRTSYDRAPSLIGR
jgi:hypothetical protein